MSMDQHHSMASDAALATLRMNKYHLTKDPLLALVILTASPLQLDVVVAVHGLQTVHKDSKHDDGPLLLATKNETFTLSQRNAIIRWIVGLGFHNALDRASPKNFMGGYNDSAKASPTAALAIAQISSWMSMADSIRNGSTDSTTWAQRMDEYLSSRAFLIASSRPTLADYDVCFAFIQHSLSCYDKNNDNNISTSIDSSMVWTSNKYTHLHRWIDQVLKSALDLVTHQSQYRDFRHEETHEKKEELFLAEEATTSFIGMMQRYQSAMKYTNTLQHSPHIFIFPKDEVSNDHNKTLSKDMDNTNKSTITTSTSKSSSSMEKNPSDMQSSSETKTHKKDKKTSSKKTETPPSDKINTNDSVSNIPIPSEPSNSSKTVKNTIADETKDIKDSLEFNISALDIRVGQIIKAWPHESADKLYCEEINLGEDKPRLIASGLRPFYSLEEMQNQRVLVLCNLKARNLVGFPSHGMVLCASNHDHTQVEFVIPPESASIGERVSFEGYSGLPEPENKIAKKKILEIVLPFLKTDDEGIVEWKGVKSSTSVGPCVSSRGMKNAHVA